MAMTKAERAYLEAVETELAFRWPMEADPERMPAPVSNKTVEGWKFNTYTMLVERAWSRSTSNGSFWQGKLSSGSPGAARLYRTEADAYLALRWAMCRDFAKKLRVVDLRAKSEPQP